MCRYRGAGERWGRFGVDFDPLKISCSRVLTGAVIRCTSTGLCKASLSLGTSGPTRPQQIWSMKPPL